MSWTKRQIVTAAYTELGLANYVFDLEPEQLQTACFQMDAMFAYWEGMGIHLGYTASDDPTTTSLDDSSGIPGYANAAAYLNLAIAIAPSMGKSVAPETAAKAKRTYMSMLSKTMVPVYEMQLPATLGRGAGRKNLERPFSDTPTDNINTGPEGQLDLFN